MNTSTSGLYGQRAARVHPQAKPAVARRAIRASERQATRAEIAAECAHLRVVKF
jgi:hypothetical protein